MIEAEKRRAGVVGTYEISLEKVLNCLGTKEIFTQAHADYMFDQLF